MVVEGDNVEIVAMDTAWVVVSEEVILEIMVTVGEVSGVMVTEGTVSEVMVTVGVMSGVMVIEREVSEVMILKVVESNGVEMVIEGVTDIMSLVVDSLFLLT